jgi:LuxR family transcriptional regulator, maltose regulon positive regulatory protein
MPIPILSTKLYIPSLRQNSVSRSRLVEKLNKGLNGKLTLISASAGFGKTTLVSEWVQNYPRKVAWLSLDDNDNDPKRFMVYFLAALQTIHPTLGTELMKALQSPQPPSPEVIMTLLLNELVALAQPWVLVLDDYHILDCKPINDALTFLLDHMPTDMHLVIITREDPPFHLARLRARQQLNEIRVYDLRFNFAETSEFLTQSLTVDLTQDDIEALESRTEGWIAGLQLAVISLQNQTNAHEFIQAFSGNHHFVLDYLMEEVLHHQPEHIQTFLLHTSLLERMCGDLCNALIENDSGQKTLEYLEQINLFIIPLDNQRKWYRYHHLFADLLRQRLLSTNKDLISLLHIRASTWYEDNDLELEAFQHAVLVNDIERIKRLLQGKQMPLHFRGGILPILNWLKSLPRETLQAHPTLAVMYASVLLFAGKTVGIPEIVELAEEGLRQAEQNDITRNAIGHAALIRASVAVSLHDQDIIFTQAQRALEYLHPQNLPIRAATQWVLGYAYRLQNNRRASHHSYSQAIAMSEKIGHLMVNILATVALGDIQWLDLQFTTAIETYQRAIAIAGHPPFAVMCVAYLGMANIAYERNQLDKAEELIQQGLYLARQLEITDRFVMCELLLARLKLLQGDIKGATTILAYVEQVAQQFQFHHAMPYIMSLKVYISLQQGNLNSALQIVQTHDIPLSYARVLIAQGNTDFALQLLATQREYAETHDLKDVRLQTMILQTLALDAHGEQEQALQTLIDTLTLTQASGCIRSFVDEGEPMARLLASLASRGLLLDYTSQLLAVFSSEQPHPNLSLSAPTLLDPLSQRELEVLRLVAQGLSNQDISERLFLALDTVKGHNRRIFEKLQVQRRTEAVARAHDLGLL